MIRNNHKEDACDRSHGNDNKVFRDRWTVNSHSRTENNDIHSERMKRKRRSFLSYNTTLEKFPFHPFRVYLSIAIPIKRNICMIPRNDW